MTKKKTCKSCDFFKKKDSICEYYESNTYADTPACSKYKGEAEDNEEDNATDAKSTTETNPKDANNLDVNISIDKPSSVIAKEETHLGKKSDSNTESVNEVNVEKTEPTNSIEDSDKSSVEQCQNKETVDEDIISDDNTVDNGPMGETPEIVTPSRNTEEPHVKYVNDYTAQKMFAHPFSFHGRIRRLEFGLSYIIYMIWYSFFSALSDGYGYEESIGYVIYLLTFVPVTWFILAQGCKRCHDRNNSGWYQIIPFYGLWMLFADGDIGENYYGPNPKGKNE